MPRGDNPKSRANLRPLEKGLPKESQREIQRKGSKAGNDAQAVYRSLNQDLREQATPEVLAEINNRLLQMAKHGNLKAYELLRDGLGEKPVERTEISTTSEKLEDVFAQLGGEGLKE